MHRLLAIVVGLALIAGAGRVSPLHIHESADHDHPEHHHGLAVHEHHDAEPTDTRNSLRLENCEPGQHAIGLVFVCTTPAAVHGLDAEFLAFGAPSAILHAAEAVWLADVRVHGPPSAALIATRAPPIDTRL